MHTKRGRIQPSFNAGERRELQLQEGLVEIPLTGEITIRASRLPDFHRDPADPFIVATALEGHDLIAPDERIIAWPRQLSRIDASQ